MGNRCPGRHAASGSPKCPWTRIGRAIRGLMKNAEDGQLQNRRCRKFLYRHAGGRLPSHPETRGKPSRKHNVSDTLLPAATLPLAMIPQKKSRSAYLQGFFTSALQMHFFITSFFDRWRSSGQRATTAPSARREATRP